MIAQYCQNCSEVHNIYDDWVEGEQLPLRSYIRCQFCGGCAYINKATVANSLELLARVKVADSDLEGATDL